MQNKNRRRKIKETGKKGKKIGECSSDNKKSSQDVFVEIIKE